MMKEDNLYEEPEKINKLELMEYYGYKGKFGLIKLYLRLLKNIFLQALAKRSPFPNLTVKLHRLRGVKIGEHVYIGPNVEIDLLYPEMIEIEDYVSIGMNTMIFAHSNPTNSINIKREIYPREVKKVKISRGSWIAPGCIILPGVTIGPDSVVGAGSVVTKDVEKESLYAGVPARKIRKLEFKTKR